MQLQVVRDASTTRVLLDGRLDVAGVQEVNDRFVFGVNSSAGPTILDFEKVTFIASLGIGMLVNAAKNSRRKGQRLVLLRPQPLVEETLRMAGIHNIIPILHEEGDQQTQRE